MVEGWTTSRLVNLVGALGLTLPTGSNVPSRPPPDWRLRSSGLNFVGQTPGCSIESVRTALAITYQAPSASSIAWRAEDTSKRGGRGWSDPSVVDRGREGHVATLNAARARLARRRDRPARSHRPNTARVCRRGSPCGAHARLRRVGAHVPVVRPARVSAGPLPGHARSGRCILSPRPDPDYIGSSNGRRCWGGAYAGSTPSKRLLTDSPMWLRWIASANSVGDRAHLEVGPCRRSAAAPCPS